MALNYSHRPLFTTHVSEDNLVSPVRIVNGYFMDGVPEKNGETYTGSWHASQGEAGEWSFNCGKELRDRCSSPESASKDIVDLLPSDPFGMDIKSTFTAITGWLEDLKVDCGGYMRTNSGKASQEDYNLCEGWNFIWDSALFFQPFPGNVLFNEKLNLGIPAFPSNVQFYEKLHMGNSSLPSTFKFVEHSNTESKEDQHKEEMDARGASAPYGSHEKPASNNDYATGFANGSTSGSCELKDEEKQHKEKVEGSTDSDGVPHEAFAFALGYLEVKDLLSVERVCKSLCSTVRGDPLLWRSIHIDQALNERITDDILVQLANRAQGHMQCLSLVECPRVTDDGLRRILESNPHLTKLSVPGCTRLTIEGVVANIKMHNSKKDVRGIKQLRVGGLFGLTRELFTELMILVGTNINHLKANHRPHFYHRGDSYLPYDDDRAIDVEMCPRCDGLRLIYDCPAEGCRDKDKALPDEVCRACTLCIPRCFQCGRCINNREYMETFCLEFLCVDCCPTVRPQ